MKKVSSPIEEEPIAETSDTLLVRESFSDSPGRERSRGRGRGRGSGRRGRGRGRGRARGRGRDRGGRGWEGIALRFYPTGSQFKTLLEKYSDAILRSFRLSVVVDRHMDDLKDSLKTRNCWLAGHKEYAVPDYGEMVSLYKDSLSGASQYSRVAFVRVPTTMKVTSFGWVGDCTTVTTASASSLEGLKLFEAEESDVLIVTKRFDFTLCHEPVPVFLRVEYGTRSQNKEKKYCGSAPDDGDTADYTDCVALLQGFFNSGAPLHKATKRMPSKLVSHLWNSSRDLFQEGGFLSRTSADVEAGMRCAKLTSCPFKAIIEVGERKAREITHWAFADVSVNKQPEEDGEDA